MVCHLFWSRFLTTIYRGSGVGTGGPGARPHNFVNQLTLISNQGGGSKLCPSHYCQPPRIQKAIYTSVLGIPDLPAKSQISMGKKKEYDSFVWILFLPTIQSCKNMSHKKRENFTKFVKRPFRTQMHFKKIHCFR